MMLDSPHRRILADYWSLITVWKHCAVPIWTGLAAPTAIMVGMFKGYFRILIKMPRAWIAKR